ncbi:MAG TPA: hypothetical protein VMG32_01705 [Anaeromyxobacteraceae bacterium]|nr:hypothetical protein [Anaeromyxobacteraceae bacterium]
MRGLTRLVALVALPAAAGCAAPRPRPEPPQPVPPHQADEPLEPGTTLRAGEAAQAAYGTAFESLARGDAARDGGDLDQARKEWSAAADGLLRAEAAGASAWRLTLRYQAAQLLGRAGAYERSAQLAAGVARDPEADEDSRAMGWHLAAQALVNVATAEARAGTLPPVRLLFADQRGPGPLAPQPPPGAWKSFVEAVDAYLSVCDADPTLSRPPEEQTLPSPGRLAVGASKVSYAFDDMADAQRRLAAVFSRWPSDAEALVEAIPLYLQTFLVTGDRQGYQAAAERLGQLLEEELAKAEGRSRDLFARAQDELKKAVSGAALLAAQKLFDAGKSAEAAEAFEAVAADPSSPDAASALHNAAIAWDRAGDPARAAGLRERILQEYPDSRVAPSATLTLAAFQAKKGDHAAAAKLYGDFLDRWPEHGNRCIAMQNVAAELDLAHRAADAADRYLTFGRDPVCSRANASVALIALRRARALFDQAGRPARAREAAAAADALARKPKEKGT